MRRVQFLILHATISSLFAVVIVVRNRAPTFAWKVASFPSTQRKDSKRKEKTKKKALIYIPDYIRPWIRTQYFFVAGLDD